MRTTEMTPNFTQQIEQFHEPRDAVRPRNDPVCGVNFGLPAPASRKTPRVRLRSLCVSCAFWFYKNYSTSALVRTGCVACLRPSFFFLSCPLHGRFWIYFRLD